MSTISPRCEVCKSTAEITVKHQTRVPLFLLQLLGREPQISTIINRPEGCVLTHRSCVLTLYRPPNPDKPEKFVFDP